MKIPEKRKKGFLNKFLGIGGETKTEKGFSQYSDKKIL